MKLFKSGLLVLSVLLSFQVNAGVFSSIATSKWPTKDTIKYKLDVYGFDMRVYEWTPEGNPDVRCVFTAGNENSSGTACYSIKK